MKKDTKVTENKTLYAKWTANKYTISFDTDGGENVDDIIDDMVKL